MKITPIKLQSNGAYWLASWWVGGQHKTKSIGAKAKFSKREAMQQIKSLEREHAITPAKAMVSHAPTLGDWCTSYIELRTDVEDSTLDMHKVTIAYLKAHIGGNRRIDKISRLDAADFRKWLGTKKGAAAVIGKDGRKTDERVDISDASVCRHIRNAKTIFEKAKGLDLIAINPFDRERGTPQGIEKDWRELDEQTIATLIDRTESPEWRRLFALCAYAGLRRGEALRLKWADINLDKHRLKVRTKHGRENTKQKVREVLIVPELADVLGTPPAADGFVAKVADHNIERDAAAAIKAAGLEPWTPPFHTLRKWRATSWRETYPESVVDSWLGHSLQVARENYNRVPETHYGPQAPKATQIAAQLATLPPEQIEAVIQSLTARRSHITANSQSSPNSQAAYAATG